MIDEPDIKIIAFNDKYARDAVKMWRASKEQALGQKDIHSFNDHYEWAKNNSV